MHGNSMCTTVHERYSLPLGMLCTSVQYLKTFSVASCLWCSSISFQKNSKKSQVCIRGCTFVTVVWQIYGALHKASSTCMYVSTFSVCSIPLIPGHLLHCCMEFLLQSL